MTADGSEWPIDPDGEEGSNDLRRFDMAILSKFVPKSAFPLSTKAFLDAHGEKPVRLNYHRVVSVATLFEHVDAETFETKTEFHRAVGDAIRAGGYWEFTAEE
ncbi:MAG: DUF5785 family protein [Halobacteriota archaeon]